MTTQKRYKNVSELVQATSPDAEFKDEFEKRIGRRRIVKQLVAMRAVKGFSQQDIADRLHCTQSRVSKLEGMYDEDARLGDLQHYASVVDCAFVAGLQPRDMKPVDKVKCHVFAIKKHMDDLAELAKADEKVADGVARFFSELFFNFARLFGDSVKRLPLAPNDVPYLDFRLAEICPCQQVQVSADRTDDVSRVDDNRLLPAAL
jgi:transcriptional regulator with XRE-family HTH domain